VATEEVVARHPAEETCVYNVDGGSFVHSEASEGAEEDFEDLVGRDCRGVGGVEGVDTLDDEDASLGDGEAVAGRVSEAGLHIINGGVNFLAVNEGHDVIVDEGYVHGLNVVVVAVATLLPLLIARLAVEGEVVVVDGELCRRHASVSQVLSQLSGEGGLTGGGGASDGDDAHLRLEARSGRRLTREHLVDNLLNFPLLTELGAQDVVLAAASHLLQFVNVTHTAHRHGFAPFGNVEKRTFHASVGSVVAAIEAQRDEVTVLLQLVVAGGEAASGGEKAALEEAGVAIAFGDVYRVLHTRLEKLLVEGMDRRIGLEACKYGRVVFKGASDGLVIRNDGGHRSVELGDVSTGDRAVQLEEIAVAGLEAACKIYASLLRGHRQDETESPVLGIFARGIPTARKTNVLLERSNACGEGAEVTGD
jgi:hypothetical protein